MAEFLIKSEQMMTDPCKRALSALMSTLDFSPIASAACKERCAEFLQNYKAECSDIILLFIRHIMQACEGNSLPLLHLLFHPQVTISFMTLNVQLRAALGASSVSLKNLTWNTEKNFDSTYVLQMADFSHTHKLETLADPLTLIYAYRFSKEEEMRHALFSSHYLQHLAHMLLYRAASVTKVATIAAMASYNFVRSASAAAHLSLNERLAHNDAAILLSRFIDLLHTQKPRHHFFLIRSSLDNADKKYSLKELYQLLLSHMTPFDVSMKSYRDPWVQSVDARVKTLKNPKIIGYFYGACLFSLSAFLMLSQRVPNVNLLFLSLLTVLPFFGISFEKVLSFAYLFIEMPLHALSASYLAAELMDYRLLGLDRQTHEIGVMIATFLPLYNISYAAARQFFAKREGIAYRAATGQAPALDFSPATHAVIAAAKRMNYTLFLMSVPYLSIYAMAYFLGSESVPAAAKLSFIQYLNYSKCGISLFYFMWHWHHKQKAPDTITQEFENNKVMYWGIEAAMSLFFSGLEASLNYLHAPPVSTALVVRNHEPLSYRVNKGLIHAYAPRTFLFFSPELSQQTTETLLSSAQSSLFFVRTPLSSLAIASQRLTADAQVLMNLVQFGFRAVQVERQERPRIPLGL